MNTPFNVFVENQKKFYDNWMEMTQNMSTTKKQETNKAGKEGFDMFQDFFASQKELFENSFKMGDPKETSEKMSRQYNEWLELQQSFFKKWMQNYNDPKASETNPLTNGEWMQKQVEMWKEMNQRGMEWINDNLFNHLPDSMKPHFKNYLHSVEVLNKNWETIYRMITQGVFNPATIEKMMNKDLQKQFVEAYFGMKMPSDSSQMLEQIRTWFDKMINAVESGDNPMGNWVELWSDSYKRMSKMDIQPGYRMILDMQKTIIENSEPFFSIAGESKQHRLTRELRDLQFAFTAYMVHSIEMQQHLYEASGNAMTETIRTFSEKFSENGEAPDMNVFFNSYVEIMENHLTEVLKSDEYSRVQSEMVKFGAKVKMLTEETLETMMEDFPFVPRSEGDEMNKQTTALKRKVRELEKKVAELNQAIDQIKAKPKEEVKATRATTKAAATKTTASKSSKTTKS